MKLVKVLQSGHTGQILGAAHHPAKDFVVSGDSDGALRFWNLAKGSAVVGKVIHFGAPPVIKAGGNLKRAINDDYSAFNRT